MLGVLRVRIAEHQRGLLFPGGRFARVLWPGQHWLAGLSPLRVDRCDLRQPRLEHPLADFLAKTHAELRESTFQVVELGDREVGLAFVDGRLSDVVPPASRRIYWRGMHEVRVERFPIAQQFEVPRAWVGPLGHLRGAHTTALAEALLYSEVQDGHAGLLLVDGRSNACSQRVRTPSGSTAAACRSARWTAGCARPKSRASRSSRATA